MGPDSKSGALRSVQSLRLVFGVVLFAAAASAAAQSAQSSIYSCTANGRTYSGDRPPAECANSDIRELNRDGSLRRVIPRPLSVEEQRARALEAKKRLEDEERTLSQRRRDRSLLEAYANEDEIEAARTKALDSSQVVIARSSQRIENLKIEKKRLDDESEFYKKREVPDSIKRGYILNTQSVSAEERVIAEARAEMQRINERFDAEKKRFRELLAQGARPVQRNPEPDILLDPRFRGK
jgi:hypothetical protein